MCNKMGIVDIDRMARGALVVESDLKEIETRLVVLKGGVVKRKVSPEFIAKELDALLQIVRR